jgi:predicted O-methyltransferase YrrM
MKRSLDAIVQADQARYLESIEPPRDSLLQEMEALAATRDLPISDPEVASFLAVTAAATSPRFIVELGTNIGYGAIVLARAAGPSAKVLTVEYDPGLCETARGFIERAGLSSRIEVRQGKALEVLDTLPAGIGFAYVDCVKEEYPAYLERLVPRMVERAVLVADNVLWRGHVARDVVPERERARAGVLRSFNKALVSHPQLRGVVLPLGDGVAYAVKGGFVRSADEPAL